jgi:hypothetical protein
MFGAALEALPPAQRADIAQDSMTLVKNDHSVLPLADGSGKHLHRLRHSI